MTPKIVLHHLEKSRSDRLFWVLEELGLEYEVKAYARLPSRAAPPELKKVAPLGKAPAITIDDRLLVESGYIIHHLLNHYPSNQLESNPSESSIYWSHLSEGSLMLQLQASMMVQLSTIPFGNGLVPGFKFGEEGKNALEAYSKFFNDIMVKRNVQALLDEANQFLSQHEYFSGSDKPGQGDFMMFFPINSLVNGTRKNAGYNIGEHTRKWLDRVMSREACKKGMERLRREEEEQCQKSKI